MSKTLEYKCLNCGGGLSFNSTAQKVVCPYCDTEFEVADLLSYENDIASDIKDDMSWSKAEGGEWAQGEEEGLAVYSCSSCGGEIIAEKTTSATFCPYCNNPVILSGNLQGALKPDHVIPFKKSKEDAMQALKSHLKGKLLLPKSFMTDVEIEEIKGVYVPFWLFDADVFARIRYRATKVRSWATSNYIYTETKHYGVVRGGDIGFDHIPADGSKKMDDTLMEAIEPYNFNEAESFSAAYLSGYSADKYDVGEAEVFPRANDRIRTETKSQFDSTVSGYSSVRTESSNIQLKRTKTSYALYPVWMLASKWKDKSYTFAMNGQTGKMVGDLPTDPLKFTLWLLGTFVLFGALIGTIVFFAMEEFDPFAVILGALFGIIPALITVFVMKGSLKSVKKQTGAHSYYRAESFRLREREDRFLFRTVTRVRRANNSHKRH